MKHDDSFIAEQVESGRFGELVEPRGSKGDRRRSRMRAFEQSGRIETRRYRQSLIYVGIFGAALIGRGLYGIVQGGTGQTIFSLVALGIGCMFEIGVIRGTWRRRQRKRAGPETVDGPGRRST